MKQGNIHETSNCKAVSGVLARIGDKWSVLIVSRLGERAMRFNEIKREIGGISQRMLTLTLRGLERDGLVTRTVFPTIPPRVDYALTALGRSLLVPVSALGDWALKNIETINGARAAFDAATVPKRPKIGIASARPTRVESPDERKRLRA
jgi:DNA-binding HxlR family transcriptional regulator